MNRFLYAEGNPWTIVDPSGHASYYEGGGCGPGGKYCGSTGNDQQAKKSVKTVLAKAHTDYIHHPKARMYDPEATPTVSSEWASGDTWGENTSIGLNGGSSSGGIREFQYSDGEDGPVGVLKGVVGGVGDFAVGAITTPIYALTHLSDAAAGLQCYGMDGCLAGAAHDLGWDHPVSNLGAGWDAFVHMSDQDKAKFVTGVTLTGLTLRAGFKGIRGMRGEPSVMDTGPDIGDAGVGPYGGSSIPARGPLRNFSVAERSAIDDIGRDTGCHTCGTQDPGTKLGHFVPDHQPPTSLVPPGTPQRLYPQCIFCSRDQGLLIARMLQEQGR